MTHTDMRESPVQSAMEVVTLACGCTRRLPFRRLKRRKVFCYRCPGSPGKQKVVMRRTVKGLPR